VKSEFLQFAYYALALVLGGAAEELLPKYLGVGFPVLMALSASAAIRKPVVVMVLVALAAGAFEDSLSSLPQMTSPCFFLAVAVVAWRTRLAKAVLILAYPLYQVWLKLVVPGFAGLLGVRTLVAVPIAVFMAYVVFCALTWIERKAAIDEV